MIAYAFGWGLVAYVLLRLPAALFRSDRLATWAIYAASATTITKLLGY
ncbi:hypothetical protein K388_01909 [Streptomyces sp. KhCrAH-43]|nr:MULTISPECIES: hypothetical protein [unclassified Streptomyces]RAJ64714.1 hypothetical protein K388_01909 [Streptomyces sp. KhCrAH-43]